jgi:hypothetical protein
VELSGEEDKRFFVNGFGFRLTVLEQTKFYFAQKDGFLNNKYISELLRTTSFYRKISIFKIKFK